MSGNSGFDDIGAVASAVKANEQYATGIFAELKASSLSLKREACLAAELHETPMERASSSRMIWLFVMGEKCHLK